MGALQERLKQWGSKLQEAWSKLSLNQKVLFAGAALLLILAGTILTAGQATNYEVLYASMNSKDAAAVVAKLDEYKVPYQLQDNGATILVASEQKDQTRLKLAGENLPAGESGFELFQTTNFGETESDKKVKYQMALQGELARTIQGLDKVKAAKVNLAIPEPTLFSDEEEKAKASVVINTKSGQTLNSKEVQSVVNLVANSVNGLTRENVVIVDQNGTLLSDNLPLDDAASSDQLQMQMAMKREVEREKQAAIQSMLDKTLGKDNAVVRVNAELNFNKKEERAERYTNDPDGAHVRSESVVKESTTEVQGAPSGTPGVDTNVPEYAETDGGTSGGTSDKSSRQTNYEVSKTETDTKYSQGDVKYDYLTVSVIVNNKAIKDVNLGNNDEEKSAKIRSMVATACGLRENRQNENVKLNDNISVAFMDFVPEAEPETETSSFLDKLLDSPILPFLLLLLSVFIIAMVWLKKKKAEEEPLLEQEVFSATVDEELRIEDIFDMNLSPEEKERLKIKEEIDKLVDNDPENAAQVLKTWMLDDSR